MADPERFKRPSPVTTDSPVVKCKRLRLDFGVATEKKRLQPAHAKTRIQYISEGHYI